MVFEVPRLSLAHHAAAHFHGPWRLRHHDVAHEKLVPRRDPQAICDDRAHERPLGAPRALWPRFPQRHAHHHRGFPRRVCARVFHGLGLLGFESVLNRDYPVVFATLYIFSLVGLVIGLISDLTYTWVDPRIDFETREV